MLLWGHGRARRRAKRATSIERKLWHVRSLRRVGRVTGDVTAETALVVRSGFIPPLDRRWSLRFMSGWLGAEENGAMLDEGGLREGLAW
jgi:hypothetical protein